MQQRTKFLIVDDDDLVYELITEQILNSGEFEFLQASSGEEAINLVKTESPDLILLDLVMPGLTGNDVLVAIRQHGFEGQIIVSTKRGSEDKAIEAFRLGATDFITKPLRPPELMTVIEHALKAVRLRSEKDLLVQAIRKTNAELQTKVQELTSLTNLGSIITRMNDPEQLFEVALAAMLDLTNADFASIILRNPSTGALILHSGKNLTLVMQDQLGETVKDEIADLVLTSQQPLAASGAGLQRFRLSREIRAVVYAPMIAHGNGIGVLTVGNFKKRTEFSQRHADLLRSIADYMAVGLTNVRLFDALSNSARESKAAMEVHTKQRTALLTGLAEPIKSIQEGLKRIRRRPLADDLKAEIEELEQTAYRMNEILKRDYESRGIHRITPPKSS